MKIKYISILLILLFLSQGLIAEQQDNNLFEKAKLYLFDKEWNRALIQLNTLIQNFPQSKLYPLSLFYKAKCLEELKKPKEALENYSGFLKISKNRSLMEEANIAIIDLCFYLYKKGEKGYIKTITRYLKKKNRMVQYYAAFKLSYAKEKRIAEPAVQVLKKMIEEEDDPELIDRAKIALMRINPSYLKAISKKRDIAKLILKIRIFDKKTKKESLSLNIPFVLAKLALNALPEEGKEVLQEKGYDIDSIIKTLTSSNEILRIENESTIYKIWIE